MKNKYINTVNRDATSLHSLLTRKQVAQHLGVHTETIKRYQQRGTLPAIVINSRVTRYDPADVEKLIQEGRLNR